jgi:hypothetical protein
MSQNAAAKARRFVKKMRALWRDISSPAPEPVPVPVPVLGALAKPTPEWVFKQRQSSDDPQFEPTIGVTLNGPRVPLAQPDVSFGDAVRAMIECREIVARVEGERQARLQGTRAAIDARQAQVEERRKAIRSLCEENGWRFNARGNARRIKRKLEKDPRFRGGDNMPLHMVSRRTVADDLIYLATTS